MFTKRMSSSVIRNLRSFSKHLHCSSSLQNTSNNPSTSDNNSSSFSQKDFPRFSKKALQNTLFLISKFFFSLHLNVHDQTFQTISQIMTQKITYLLCSLYYAKACNHHTDSSSCRPGQLDMRNFNVATLRF